MHTYVRYVCISAHLYVPVRATPNTAHCPSPIAYRRVGAGLAVNKWKISVKFPVGKKRKKDISASQRMIVTLPCKASNIIEGRRLVYREDRYIR